MARRPAFVATTALPLLLTLALSGCTLEKVAEPDEPLADRGPSEAAAAWIGDYLGDGAGVVDGLAFEKKDARLHIALDADSVRLQSCSLCVTVTLDAVFALANVRLTDAVELNLAYDDGPVHYTLAVRRFSANGEVGNAVTARVTIGEAGVPTPFFDVSYLLARP